MSTLKRSWVAYLARPVAALGLAALCRTTDAAGPLPGYDVYYGLGLSRCTETCRPFGVLHFGVVVLRDGSVSCECECMPGPALDVKEEDDNKEVEDKDSPGADSGEKKPVKSIHRVRPTALHEIYPGPSFGLTRPFPTTRP